MTYQASNGLIALNTAVFVLFCLFKQLMRKEIHQEQVLSTNKSIELIEKNNKFIKFYFCYLFV